MIKLTRYSMPSYGERFKTSPIWVNPKLICTISTYEAVVERTLSGEYSKERVTITVIGFAANDSEEQLCVSVLEDPDFIVTKIQMEKEKYIG